MPIYNPIQASNFLYNLFLQSANSGDVHYSVNTSLTADLFCQSLIIDAGVTLTTNNWRIFCLTSISNQGIISNSGSNGTNGTVAVGGTGGTTWVSESLYDGRAGGNGAFNGANGSNAAVAGPFMGADGGVGGDAGAFTGGTNGASTIPTVIWDFYSRFNVLTSIPSIIDGDNFTIYASKGGGGGAADTGTAGGGGGGGGGGLISIYSTSLVNNGSIISNGGNGGDAHDDGSTDSSGGGGGGGGIILLYTNNLTAGTLTVAGGTEGIAAQGGNDGDAGLTGEIIKSFLP